MNDIPSGAIVLIVAVATIFAILFYGMVTDAYSKRQEQRAIKAAMPLPEDPMRRMWRKMREEQEARRKKMERLAAERRRRDTRQVNRRRFLGSHR